MKLKILEADFFLYYKYDTIFFMIALKKESCTLKYNKFNFFLDFTSLKNINKLKSGLKSQIP